MKALKKFFAMFFAAMPFSAGAIAPIVGGLIAGGVGILGVSIWRSVSPVDTKEAFNFFSSCWTCQVFSDIMVGMSNLIPAVYKNIGRIIIPVSVALLAVYIAWRLVSNMLNNKLEDGSKIAGNFSAKLVKLTTITALLLMPLPYYITHIAIEPAFQIGTSFDNIVSQEDTTFSDCMVATALQDSVNVSIENGNGAFSPNLRHQMTCELAHVHQVTGLGITVGWAMMNMAFDIDYWHKILDKVPFFTNVILFFAGLLVLVLFFYALLPIPMYFLEVFIKLAMDLIMLPLMLMAWLFDGDDFTLLPKGGRTIRQMIDDVVQAVVGIALTIILLSFAIMFLNAAFGGMSAINNMKAIIESGDSKQLIDGLMLNNDSFITVILMGVFIAMFMTMIPQLTSMFFKVKISDKYYQTARNDLTKIWSGAKKFLPIRKNKSSVDGASSGSSNGGDSSGQSGQDPNRHHTLLKYIESSGMQYIDTGIEPDSNTEINITCEMTSAQNPGGEIFLCGARDAAGSNSFAIEMFHDGNPNSVYFEHGSANNTLNSSGSLTGTETRLILGKNFCSIGGSASANFPDETFSTSHNIYLFALNDHGHFVGECACKLSYCEIKKNGTPIRTFLPALDDKGVPCLLETKENKFYYNQRSGGFTAGPKS